MAFVRLLKDLMRDKEFGQRIVPIIPDEARTFGMDSFFPTVEDLQPARAALHLGRPRADAGLQGVHAGPDPARRHQRGRLGGGVHRGRHVVRHARRADDPDLRLLLDVRLPAHRRLDLGGRRPDGPRLPHRRHRRPHHADRRGPAARRRPLARCSPRPTRPSSPTTRPTATRSRTSSRTACAGCTATTPRTSCTTSRSTTSRSCSRRSRRTSTSRASCAASTCWRAGPRGPGRRARRVQLLASGVGVPWALEAQQLLATTGASRPTSGR